MKETLKAALFALAPRATTALLSARARAHSQRVAAGWGCGEVNRELFRRFGDAVLGGPFAGVVLTPMTMAEQQAGPVLLGVYESELDGAWDEVLGGSFPQILDVGAKFGYYAVGLARRYPAAKVVAFDTDPWARKATREVAQANGVANLEIRGYCDPAWLAGNLRDDALILSDCEGYESVLFGSPRPATMDTATLIIETHESDSPGVVARLTEAFGPTHDVRLIGDEQPKREPTVPLDFFTDEQRRLAAHEVRSPQNWLLALPRAGANRKLAESAARALGATA